MEWIDEIENGEIVASRTKFGPFLISVHLWWFRPGYWYLDCLGVFNTHSLGNTAIMNIDQARAKAISIMLTALKENGALLKGESIMWRNEHHNGELVSSKCWYDRFLLRIYPKPENWILEVAGVFEAEKIGSVEKMTLGMAQQAAAAMLLRVINKAAGKIEIMNRRYLAEARADEFFTQTHGVRLADLIIIDTPGCWAKRIWTGGVSPPVYIYTDPSESGRTHYETWEILRGEQDGNGRSEGGTEKD